ncbi:hypothetical protein CS006_00450 [Bifidobacterium primatium]|uniref:Uncharacterized protein n=1 Tax=Bifidobacterium primatium TaxID=2045438 RepID=A0A2M9HA64_9BIFI|nr:hypothetical protein CS006_00450 [Bifidobacterium primatium]
MISPDFVAWVTFRGDSLERRAGRSSTGAIMLRGKHRSVISGELPEERPTFVAMKARLKTQRDDGLLEPAGRPETAEFKRSHRRSGTFGTDAASEVVPRFAAHRIRRLALHTTWAESMPDDSSS